MEALSSKVKSGLLSASRAMRKLIASKSLLSLRRAEKRPPVIFKPSEKDLLAFHVPDDLWKLTKMNDVYIKDEKTGELVLLLDLTNGEERGVVIHARTDTKDKS